MSMQVVILAGGLGTRLRPLTYHTPKAMVPIRGKPFLEYTFELLKNNGLEDILICAGYLGEKIREYFREGGKVKARIRYSFEKDLLGTAGALKNAEGLLDSEFMVVNGDTFLDIDYQDLISYFRERGKLGTIVAFKNRFKTMANNLNIDDKNEVVNYDKIKEDNANCVDAGVQIFKREILAFIPENKEVSLEKEIFPILIQKRELSAYSVSQMFYDIGTPRQLREFIKHHDLISNPAEDKFCWRRD